MPGQNISNVIEKYLKKVFGDNNQIEISRSEVANLFDVVPSQINYVIKTRFTIANGYLVKSKRGGGGYIRIKRVHLINNSKPLDVLIRKVGSSLSQKDGISLVRTLFQNQILNKRDSNVILAVISKRALDLNDTDLENKVRAQIMISILNHLRYEI